MKRRVKKVYKKLPPHTYEAHPVANAGEASKPLIIGIIAIVAIIALSLLLLFSGQFVGKAIELGGNTAGAELNSAKAYSNQPFSMNISTNTLSEVNTLSLQVNLPSGVMCNQVTITPSQQLVQNGWTKFENKCENNKVSFTYGSFEAGVQGKFDVAYLSVQGLAKAPYTFDLSLEAYDNSVPPKNIIAKVDDFTVGVIDAVCGDGIIQTPNTNNMMEECDGGSDCNAQCKKEAMVPPPPVQLHSAGADIIPATVSEKQQFSLKVKTDTGSEKVQQILFNLKLPMGVDCTGVSVENLLIKDQTWVENEPARCENGEIILNSEATSDSEGNLIDKSGLIEVAQVSFPGYSAGTLSFVFSKFIAYDADNKNLITETINPVVNIMAPSCGDGNVDINNMEVCDGNNFHDKTCATEGFTGGTLSCASDCKSLNTVMCTKQVQAVCDDANPSLCMTQMTCTGANNFWSNNACYDACPSGTEDPNNDKVCTAVQQQQQFICTGTTPTNSLLCSGDDMSLSSNLAKTAASQCGTPKCEYQCNTNYIPNAQGTDCLQSSPPNASSLETPQLEGITVTGKKITITDITAANNLFSTKITATETFTNEVTIYTILYGLNDKVLSIKSEKVENGLAKDAVYIATVNYPEVNVKKKSVIVYDLKQNPSVFGQLLVQKS